MIRAPTGALVAGLLSFSIQPLPAQEPPDSAVADSAAVADSISDQVADSVSADTIFHNLPEPRDGVPAGFATGVWSWDRHAIMASGANTLGELFETVPGLIPLLGGDYGTPQAMSAFGLGAGAYRVVRDGFELYTVDGSVADLQQIGLVGVELVRLDRSMGRMEIEIRTHRYDDGRPFSVVEAGTGDLDTNLFRGVYADPSALLGSVAVGLERIDTRGRGAQREEGGNRTGSWARYQYHFGDRAGIALDYRKVGSQTRVTQYAPEVSRTDLTLQASWRPVGGVVLQALTGRSSLDWEPPVGSSFTGVGGSRRQHSVRLGLERGPFWLDGTYRLFEGGLPTRRIEAGGGLSSMRWGGASGRFARASWQGAAATSVRGRVWLRPVEALTLFGAYETGDFGARAGPVADGPPRPPLPLVEGIRPGRRVVTEREGLRVGASLSLWGVTLGGAALYAHSDSVAPLGLELDTGAPVVAGVHRNGYEAVGVLPTPMQGLTLEGSYQWWDEEGPYLPAQIYRASFEYHRVFLDSGNLEVWGSLGVRGHDPMLTFAPGGTEEGPGIVRVPFYQSWYVHAQARIVTVRLWLGMDNMTFRRNLQMYPGRTLPFARSFFALRWDMWN